MEWESYLHRDVFCPSSSIFLPTAHLLQPAWLILAQDAAGSKLLDCSAPSPLWVLPGRALVNTPDFVPLWNEKASWNARKRLAGQETCFLFCIGVCQSAAACLEQLPFFWRRTRFAVLFPWVWLIWCPVWNSEADFIFFFVAGLCFLCGVSQCVVEVHSAEHLGFLKWSLWFW